MKISVNTKGVEEVVKLFSGLPDIIQKKALLPAVTKVCQNLTKDAKNQARQSHHKWGHGVLYKALGYRVRRYRKSAGVFGYVGAKVGYRAPIPHRAGKQAAPGHYLQVAERGRKAVKPINKRILSNNYPVRTSSKFFMGKEAAAYSGSKFMERTYNLNKAAGSSLLIQAVFDAVSRAGRGST